MKKYDVNKNAQSNGDHEVHHIDCTYLPSVSNRSYLGEFSTGDAAVREAKKKHIPNPTDAKHALNHVTLPNE